MVNSVIPAVPLVLKESVGTPDGLVRGYIDKLEIPNVSIGKGQTLVIPFLLKAKLSYEFLKNKSKCPPQ